MSPNRRPEAHSEVSNHNLDYQMAFKCSINDSSFPTCERRRRGSQQKEESSSRLAPPRPPPEFYRTTARVSRHHRTPAKPPTGIELPPDNNLLDKYSTYDWTYNKIYE
ncbi:hypothetical protein M5K25_022536 [Dendrobium thyrsiflorum]|uniref:Uncharacterized protein n=1 Tax=Dendrobium thyrsiflorum TaxID=117978 RepID=A0ABD0UCY3_DENTH